MKGDKRTVFQRRFRHVEVHSHASEVVQLCVTRARLVKGGTLRALAMGVRSLDHGSDESHALRTSERATRIEIL
jgi:hypothetical protein